MAALVVGCVVVLVVVVVRERDLVAQVGAVALFRDERIGVILGHSGIGQNVAIDLEGLVARGDAGVQHGDDHALALITCGLETSDAGHFVGGGHTGARGHHGGSVMVRNVDSLDVAESSDLVQVAVGDADAEAVQQGVVLELLSVADLGIAKGVAKGVVLSGNSGRCSGALRHGQLGRGSALEQHDGGHDLVVRVAIEIAFLEFRALNATTFRSLRQFDLVSGDLLAAVGKAQAGQAGQAHHNREQNSQQSLHVLHVHSPSKFFAPCKETLQSA